LPIPGAIALLAAGAALAAHDLTFEFAIGLPILAALTGDVLLYLGGRYTGWSLLGQLCRFSLNPETCILRAARSFYERGRAALLFAKFLPGVNTMAPPLAGSLNMGPLQFVRLDFIGVLLYVGAYETAGYAFRDVLERVLHNMEAFGHVAQSVLLVLIGGYVAYRLSIYWRYRKYRLIPTVTVDQVAQWLKNEPETIVIADVRSHGYYDAGTHRIRPSIRIEPNNIEREADRLPKAKQIFLYCT
jgi:membrane protein DedA with SNARE-associated domain